MSIRYIGGVVSATTPSPNGPFANGAAPGIWSLQTQMQSRRDGKWPVPTGGTSPTSAVFTSPGAYAWLCPSGVTSVSAVAVGGGAGGGQVSTTFRGGGGGGLGWRNNISVTPGQAYPLLVGAGGIGSNGGSAGGDSYFINPSTVRGGGGGVGDSVATGGTFTGTGGGNGGAGMTFNSASGNAYLGGGGGAGGYAGNGGIGGYSNAPTGPAKIGIVYETFNNSGGSTSAKVYISPEVLPVTFFLNRSMYAAVQLSNGNIFVAWCTSTTNFSVKFAIYSPTGSVVVASTTIEAVISSTSLNVGIKVALTRGGNVAIVWDRFGSGVGNVANCYYAVYNASGTLVKSAAVAATGSLDNIFDFQVRTCTQSSTGFLLAALCYQSVPSYYVFIISYGDTGTQLSRATTINNDPNNNYQYIDVAQLTGNSVAVLLSRNQNTALYYNYASASNLTLNNSGSFDGGAFTIYSVQAVPMSNGNVMCAYLASSSIRYAIFSPSSASVVGSVNSVAITAINTSFSRLAATRLSDNNILFNYAVGTSCNTLNAVIVNNTPSVVQAETTISSQLNATALSVVPLSGGGFFPVYNILGGGGFGGLARFNSTGDPGGNVGASGLGLTDLVSGGTGSPSAVATGGGGGAFNNNGNSGFVRLLYGTSQSFPYNAA